MNLKNNLPFTQEWYASLYKKHGYEKPFRRGLGVALVSTLMMVTSAAILFVDAYNQSETPAIIKENDSVTSRLEFSSYALHDIDDSLIVKKHNLEKRLTEIEKDSSYQIIKREYNAVKKSEQKKLLIEYLSMVIGMTGLVGAGFFGGYWNANYRPRKNDD